MIKTYDSYKDSGIPWIGEIPEGWKISPLKRILNGSLQYGANESGIPYDNVLPRFIRITDILDNKLRDDIDKQSLVEFKSNGFILKDKDILFARSGATVGKTFLYKESYGRCAFAGYLIRASINKENDAGYIYYFTQSPAYDEWKNRKFIQSTIQNIGADKYSIMPVVLPSLPEQRAIATYLDEKCADIDNLISLQEEMIKELEAYKQTVITEVVTKGLDPNVPMKDSGIEWIGEIPETWNISKIKRICTFGPNACKDFNFKIVGYAPMNAIRNGVIDAGEIEIKNITSGLTYFEDGDIVMAKVTPCFENGNIAVANNLKNGRALGSSELFVFRATKVNNYFLYYALQNGFFKNLCVSTMTGTGGLKRISPSFLINTYLPIPCEAEQKNITTFLDKKCTDIDSLISIRKKKIDELKEYKKGVIFEAVTGKIKVV